jgi:serine protease Do
MTLGWNANRFTRPLAGLALALALAGCQQASGASPIAQAVPDAPAAKAQGAGSAAPLSTVTLPPAPVPATFDVAALSDQVKPTVVNITTTSARRGEAEGMDPFDYFFGPNSRGGRERPARKGKALGTGFIIDPNGYVVTNEHVVRDAEDVRVHLNDEREFKAEVVGSDPRLDVALLRLHGAKNLPTAPLGQSDPLRVGEHVLAVGNPFGLGHTVTLGIVSAKARSIGAGPYDDFIQTDASINPGNSGGPLFNWRGEVVGINTAIKAGANGIGFAIPVDAVKDVLPQLRDKGHVERGKLGLAFQPITADLSQALGLEAPRGALVADVEPGGSAARAGIRSGDVVLAVNGVPIHHAEELPRRVARNQPGTAIKLSIVRNKQQREVTATLDALQTNEARTRPGPSKAQPSPESERLGLMIADDPSGGVRVQDVLQGSEIRDLQPGDVIIEADGKPVRDIPSLRAALKQAKPGTTSVLKVRRGRLVQFAAIPIPKR